MKSYFAEHAWLSDGWHEAVAIDIDAAGNFIALVPRSERGERELLGRWVLPGIPNLHSHAFQRAMAGLAERQTDPADSFWTWREVMYGFAQTITPDQLHAIAAQLYLEMLEAGYTQVCEFHYLHHAPGGRPYDDPTLMSQALLAAADKVGIGITLLPVLYQTGGFDGRPLSERQRRFGCSIEQYLDLYQRLAHSQDAQKAFGLCFHSLRAVPEAAMREVLDAVPGTRPVHIHIAEQMAEVEDCLQLRGARPVRWLLDHMPVDVRWTLVHATHVNAAEVAGMAQRGVTVGLCPSTEGNLGDGLFPLSEFHTAGGMWGIGSDSHISVSPVEELRWLEYGQRLQRQRRNIAVLPQTTSSGECLLSYALAGGARASGRPIGWFEDADEVSGAPGTRADLIVLDHEAPALLERDARSVVDSWIFSGNRPAVRDVMVGGRWRVRQGQHPLRDSIAADYRRALAELKSAL